MSKFVVIVQLHYQAYPSRQQLHFAHKPIHSCRAFQRKDMAREENACIVLQALGLIAELMFEFTRLPEPNSRRGTRFKYRSTAGCSYVYIVCHAGHNYRCHDQVTSQTNYPPEVLEPNGLLCVDT